MALILAALYQARFGLPICQLVYPTKNATKMIAPAITVDVLSMDYLDSFLAGCQLTRRWRTMIAAIPVPASSSSQVLGSGTAARVTLNPPAPLSG